MATTTSKRNTPTTWTRNTSADRSSLRRLYLARGIWALFWALAWTRVDETLDVVAIALLVAYPLIDAASSLIDCKTHPEGPERGVTALNGWLSLSAAVALGAAATQGVSASLIAFGTWAVVSGAAQLLVGIRRRGPALGTQWPMLIAGGLSLLVGISYVFQAVGAHPSLGVLSIYATGGGAFFIVQSRLLAGSARSPAIEYF